MEAKLNKTEKAAMKAVEQGGFTFYGDSFASTFRSAKRALDGLVRKGLLVKEGNEFKAA